MTAETLTSSRSIVKPQENQQANGGNTTVNNQSNVYVGEPTHYFCSCIQLETYDTISMFFGEVIGTAMLLFLGCMGSLTWGAEPHPFFGALLFGLTVMLIIQSFGCVSGAHLNPAVTIAAYIYRAITLKLVVVYIVAQVIGAILGFGLLKALTPTSIFDGNNADGGPGICSTVPHKDLTTVQAFTIEYLATTILIIICCSVWDPRNKQYQDSIPLKFGFAIAALSYGVGPFTGCSMNPVRTLGPAVWNGDYDLHWIYWVGPISSGIITSVMYKYLFRREIKIKVKTNMNGGVVEDESPTVISINY